MAAYRRPRVKFVTNFVIDSYGIMNFIHLIKVKVEKKKARKRMT